MVVGWLTAWIEGDSSMLQVQLILISFYLICCGRLDWLPQNFWVHVDRYD